MFFALLGGLGVLPPSTIFFANKILQNPQKIGIGSANAVTRTAVKKNLTNVLQKI